MCSTEARSVTSAAMPNMIGRRSGKIVNISSGNGEKGQFGQTNYSAAKAGMHGFTKALALEVARKGGVRKTLDVRLEGMPSAKEMASVDSSDNSAETPEGAASVTKLGITVSTLDQDDIQQLQLHSDQRGLVVTDVKPGGPSWGELADGDHGGPDIILSIEGKAVKTPAELRKVVDDQKAGSVVSLSIYNPRARARRIERIRLGTE